jgi:hypothetical protein
LISGQADFGCPVSGSRITAVTTTALWKIFYDAESGDKDPIRRQLAERAQALGVRLQPKVEVELKDIALRIAAGVGDTYLPSAYTHAPYYPAVLPEGPDHRFVQPGALRHVRCRHPFRQAALLRRA